MKQRIRNHHRIIQPQYWLSFCLLALFFGFSSCVTTSEIQDISKLEGTWQVDNFEISIKMWTSTTLKTSKSIAETSTYLFQKDGTFEIRNKRYPDVNSRGVWEYKPTGHALTITHKESIKTFEDATEEYQIAHLSQSKMIWKKNYGELGYVQYYMSRQ